MSSSHQENVDVVIAHADSCGPSGLADDALEGTQDPMSLEESKPPENVSGTTPRGLPLEVGTRMRCRWRDGKLHPVKVIERRKVSSSDEEYEYYVHYTECASFSVLSFCDLGNRRFCLEIRLLFHLY